MSCIERIENQACVSVDKVTNSTLIRCSIHTQDETSKKFNDSRQILVVDKSGSMAGSPWKQVMVGVRAIKEYVDAAGVDTTTTQRVECILYDSTAVSSSLEGVLGSSASGSTSFCEAFSVLQERIHASREQRIIVAFMTDGEESVASRDRVMSSLQKLRFYIRNIPHKSVVVHAIGYGKNHDVELLDHITKIGTTQGVYRYAEGGAGLDEKFVELFEFGEATIDITVTIDGSKKFKVSAEKTDTNRLTADIWIMENTTQPMNVSVKIGDSSVEIPLAITMIPVTPLFKIKRLTHMEVTTADELANVQSELSKIKMFGFQMDRSMRKELFDARAALQVKLDELHRLLSDISRGTLSSTQALAKMNDLRFSDKFTKASRARRMNQRTAMNAKLFNNLDQELNRLKIDDSEFASLDLMAYTCSLTLSSVVELMKDSRDDMIGFGICVSRPEHVVDAPSMIVVERVSVTLLSKNAYEDALRIKMAIVEPELAHGGFVSSVRPHHISEADRDRAQNANKPDNGFARGAAGEHINAWLPLYVCESHWKRVECLLAPVCGYFFTLDPAGFKQDQYVALYAILGAMIQKNGGSEREEFILAEFTKVCRALLPRAREALAGHDLVERFLKSPEGRVKGAVQNLMTIIGWAYTSGVDGELLRMPLIEEVVRRQLDHLYFGTARPVVDQHIENLLYGDKKEKRPTAGIVKKCTEARATSSKHKDMDTEFAQYAQYKITKKTAYRSEPKEVIEIEGECLLSNSDEYSARSIAPLADVRDKIANIFSSISLGSIARAFDRLSIRMLQPKNVCLSGKDHLVALAVIPPAHVSDALNGIRQVHDKAFKSWMPHCTMIYPFISLSHLDDNAATICTALSTIEPFNIHLSKFDHFNQSRYCTMFMDPITSSLNADLNEAVVGHEHLVRIFNVLLSRFPGFDDLAKVKQDTGFHPHFTVGQWPDEASVTAAQKDLSDTWKTQSWICDTIHVIARSDKGSPFSIRRSFPLGCKGKPGGNEKEVLTNQEGLALVQAAVLESAPVQRTGKDELLKRALSGDIAFANVDECGDPDGVVLRAMLIQCLRFCSNELVNRAVSRGEYLNPVNQSSEILHAAHALMEQIRRCDHDSMIDRARVLERARRCCQTIDIWSFIGRLVSCCPTRGGAVFDSICGLLQDRNRARPWPLLEEKINILFTGIYQYKGVDFVVIAEGNGWFADSTTIRKFRDVMGEDAYMALELRMRGRVCGHVYRPSDIPNRHGYHVSHPNPALAVTWGNFKG